MSQNLESYLKAIEKANHLNKATSRAAELMIGAYRAGKGAGARREQRFPVKRGRAGMGAESSACGPEGKRLPLGVPITGPCPEEFLCDCDLIGTTTFEDGAVGGNVPVGSGQVFPLVVTGFDAVALQPVAIWFTAFVAAAAPDLNQIANPVVELPCNIIDVMVGGNSQLRARGLNRALNSGAFAATREPVCVDWAEFRATNGQELTLQMQNPVAGFPVVGDTGVHFCVLLWCNVLQ